MTIGGYLLLISPSVGVATKGQQLKYIILNQKVLGAVKKNSYNVPNNLFPVCRPCHTLAHSNRQVNEEFKKELQQKIDEKEFEQNGI